MSYHKIVSEELLPSAKRLEPPPASPVICGGCGSLVGDPDTHARWHERWHDLMTRALEARIDAARGAQ